MVVGREGRRLDDERVEPADILLDFGPEDADGPADEELAGTVDLALEADAAPGSVLRGAQVIRSYLRHAPLGPGVYRMISAEGEVLYVGKAKSVKKRISSYARGTG